MSATSIFPNYQYGPDATRDNEKLIQLLSKIMPDKFKKIDQEAKSLRRGQPCSKAGT